MDAALNYLMDAHPSLLLLLREAAPKTNDRDPAAAAAAVRPLLSVLRFLGSLLRNATNKSVFNSAAELSDLLAAADDDVASAATAALAALAAPPRAAPSAGPGVRAAHHGAARAEQR